MAYEIRKRGQEKKANELCTLFGVDVCLIMYSPRLKNEETEPYLWSNKSEQVDNLIKSYKLARLGDGYSSRSRTYNLSSFYKDQIRKFEEEIEKVKKTIREDKYPNWDEQYDYFSEEELRMFTRVLTAKVEFTKETIKLFKERKDQVPESSFFDGNPGSGLGRKLEQRQFLTYLDAQSYLGTNWASFSGNNPYDANVMNSAPVLMANSFPGYEQELMISPYCFPQMNMGSF